MFFSHLIYKALCRQRDASASPAFPSYSRFSIQVSDCNSSFLNDTQPPSLVSGGQIVGGPVHYSIHMIWSRRQHGRFKFHTKMSVLDTPARNSTVQMAFDRGKPGIIFVLILPMYG
jgi:hypothetical protein